MSQSAEPANVLGVIGAGTMGAGIAQLACRAGARTLLYDPDPAALQRGRERIATSLDKLVARGKLKADAARAALACLEPVDSLPSVADCELVIEAAPESLALKRDLVAELDAIVTADCVIATNTSSLLVTAVAAGSAHPDRVVGMHFFNPPPVMRLLEIVAGEESSEAALARADATGVAMGKDVIRAHDGPGFLVNRCNRPYSLEALRLLADGVAAIEDIDRVLRAGGGFRMGPFELMDLVGVDVGFEVAKSFYEQSFGEPRWRPSPISARYVAAGRCGRKSGRGFYSYDNGSHRPDDPEPPDSGGGDGVVFIAGEGTLPNELRAAATGAGWTVADPGDASARQATLIVDCRLRRDGELPAGPRVILCDAGSLARLDADGGAAGFYALPPLAESRLVELHAHGRDGRRRICRDGALLRDAWQAHRLGRRCTRARPRPDRLSGHQRVVLRAH